MQKQKFGKECTKTMRKFRELFRNKKFEELKKDFGELENQVIGYEERIKNLENIVFALKSNVKEQKVSSELDRKKKWLNGNPDETKKAGAKA